MTRRLAAACLLAPALLAIEPASAEVRFGRNVFIGGYDFSHRRYRSVTIRRVTRLAGPAGCRVRPGRLHRRADGSVVRGLVEHCRLPARSAR